MRVRQRFVEEGLEAAFERHKPRRDYSHLVDGECEAHLVALARSAPPMGHKRWTLRLLAGKLVEREYIDCITKQDWADCMRDLVDVHFADAVRIRLVEDNLNTHDPAALYEAVEPAEARY